MHFFFFLTAHGASEKKSLFFYRILQRLFYLEETLELSRILYIYHYHVIHQNLVLRR